jgi:hypothetical protein
MDDETITARQIGYTYMINSSTFAKRYKDTLSDFETWEQKEHASEWILLPQNVGREHGIDETSLQGELYTIVHNKDAMAAKVQSSQLSREPILRMCYEYSCNFLLISGKWLGVLQWIFPTACVP